MTTPHEHPHEPPHELAESLPTDLVPIAHALDRLGAFDSAAMPAELCERIATSTATRLMEREVSRLDALSSTDRDAAPSTLEDRVFMATRGLIVRGGARLHEPAARDVHTPGRRLFRPARLAIAAMLLLTAVLSLPLLKNSNTGVLTTAPQIASAIQSDLDELAELADAVDGAGRDDVTGLNVALRTVEDALDDDLLKPAIDDGGAL